MKTRNNPVPKCVMCQAENEDTMHMLNWNKYPNKFITDIIKIPQVDDIWRWLLHFDRSYKVRMKTSQWIHSRWRVREKAIQSGLGGSPRDTGDMRDVEILDTGTGTRPDSSMKDSGQDEAVVRRGPKRKCKMKINYNQP